jgi:hypothetical protein
VSSPSSGISIYPLTPRRRSRRRQMAPDRFATPDRIGTVFVESLSPDIGDGGGHLLGNLNVSLRRFDFEDL